MPPLKIAVALGLVLGWPGLAAAQSGGPADAARPAVPAADRGRATPWSSPAEDPSSLDRAASLLNDVVAGQAPANPIRPPTVGIPPPTSSSIPPAPPPVSSSLPPIPPPTSPPIYSPASSSVPSTPRTGDRLPISPSHHVRLGEPGSRSNGPMSLLAIGSSLAVVLGLFLLVAWGIKRAMPRRSGVLPSEVVEVLGRTSLGARQQVHLIRCGGKLLLVSATPGGMETLTEIAEPDEVQRLVALCRQTQPGSTTTAFRQVFQQLAAGADHDA